MTLSTPERRAGLHHPVIDDDDRADCLFADSAPHCPRAGVAEDVESLYTDTNPD